LNEMLNTVINLTTNLVIEPKTTVSLGGTNGVFLFKTLIMK